MTKTFTNTLQEQVKEFQIAFGHPVGTKPNPIKLDRVLNRQIWTGEESIELIHASSKNEDEFREAFRAYMVGIKQAFTKQLDKKYPKNKNERIVAQADAIGDKLYFDFGDAVELGVDIEPVFNIIQEANMSKLFINEETGEKYAKYREDGKILKSEHFFTPEDKIKDEIENQINPKQPELVDATELDFN